MATPGSGVVALLARPEMRHTCEVCSCSAAIGHSNATIVAPADRTVIRAILVKSAADMASHPGTYAGDTPSVTHNLATAFAGDRDGCDLSRSDDFFDFRYLLRRLDGKLDQSVFGHQEGILDPHADVLVLLNRGSDLLNERRVL